LASIVAAAFAHGDAVTASKLPESINVAIVLRTVSRTLAGAFGTFQMRQSSVTNVNCGGSLRTEEG
jgi:hypothetical protein